MGNGEAVRQRDNDAWRDIEGANLIEKIGLACAVHFPVSLCFRNLVIHQASIKEKEKVNNFIQRFQRHLKKRWSGAGRERPAQQGQSMLQPPRLPPAPAKQSRLPFALPMRPGKSPACLP